MKPSFLLDPFSANCQKQTIFAWGNVQQLERIRLNLPTAFVSGSYYKQRILIFQKKIFVLFRKSIADFGNFLFEFLQI